MQQVPTPDVAPPENPPSVGEATDLFVEKLYGWGEAAIRNLPNLIVAAIIVVLFVFAAKLIRGLIDRVVQRTPVPAPVRHLIGSIVSILIIGAGLFVALGVLGLDRTVASLLAGVGIIGLALGFAFQDIASNFMAGVVISFRRPYQIGEIVETNDHTGVVKDINLRSTIIRKFTGETVRIPNKAILESPLVNLSETGERRVDISCGVAYGDDLEKAASVVRETLDRIEQRKQDRPAEVFFTEFGDSSINFTARFWVEFGKQTDFLKARSDAVIAIKRSLDEAGITIPFPIRTLDFGVVGGETLSEQMRKLERSGPSIDRSEGR